MRVREQVLGADCKRNKQIQNRSVQAVPPTGRGNKGMQFAQVPSVRGPPNSAELVHHSNPSLTSLEGVL